MKFGYISFDATVRSYWENSWNGKALLNIGDAAEYRVVKQLYEKAGIPESGMKSIALPELITYRGESLIVALNIALDSYVGYNKILEDLSPDILPVFLGISLTDTNLTERQVQCLKCYAPIGCRDERTYLHLRNLGIPAYLNGCTASVLDIDAAAKKEYADKIVFIDVPYAVAQHVPERLRSEIVFLSQEMYCRRDEAGDGFVPDQWADEVFACYNSKPRMIVTSRFHGAVLALAKNIPVAVTLEKYTYRFSWLKNYVPIYTEETFEKIDWNPSAGNYDDTRRLILKTSQERIMVEAKKYGDLLRLTDLQRTYLPAEASSSNQTHYYRRTWEKIKRTWDQNTEYAYAFWGVNENAQKLYELISRDFPMAKLTNIYDMFKTIEFGGIVSEHPESIALNAGNPNFYVIVTAYLAARVAPDMCHGYGLSDERIFLCEREFVRQEDI